MYVYANKEKKRDQKKKKKCTYYILLSNVLCIFLHPFFSSFIHVQNDCILMLIIIISLYNNCIDSRHTFVLFCPSTYILGWVIHCCVSFTKSINSLRHLIITQLISIMIYTILFYRQINQHMRVLV